MKITLKAIKHSKFASQETDCYTANLYVDGTKIGTVSNAGHGGCDEFWGDREKYREADAWCKANLPKWALGDEEPASAKLTPRPSPPSKDSPMTDNKDTPEPRHKLPTRRLTDTRKIITRDGHSIHLSVGFDPNEPTRPRSILWCGVQKRIGIGIPIARRLRPDLAAFAARSNPR